ncbi:hypothetical protein [Curtobacterium sp. MCSS17_016]|uniref:hypothetical protein n=1 Tax=Curtobacterium sp. MCSS17_016 TaxID=2175644 RepID=UPI0015E8BB5C|nr:hypothetical protein [Curtobacterium sp. MCSS17_016]WIE81024.1 hypothetical protein DEJ19_021140 [Curtobacterium sp. MCSS17_016]
MLWLWLWLWLGLWLGLGLWLWLGFRFRFRFRHWLWLGFRFLLWLRLRLRLGFRFLLWLRLRFLPRLGCGFRILLGRGFRILLGRGLGPLIRLRLRTLIGLETLIGFLLGLLPLLGLELGFRFLLGDSHLVRVLLGLSHLLGVLLGFRHLVGVLLGNGLRLLLKLLVGNDVRILLGFLHGTRVLIGLSLGNGFALLLRLLLVLRSRFGLQAWFVLRLSVVRRFRLELGGHLSRRLQSRARLWERFLRSVTFRLCSCTPWLFSHQVAAGLRCRGFGVGCRRTGMLPAATAAAATSSVPFGAVRRLARAVFGLLRRRVLSGPERFPRGKPESVQCLLAVPVEDSASLFVPGFLVLTPILVEWLAKSLGLDTCVVVDRILSVSNAESCRVTEGTHLRSRVAKSEWILPASDTLPYRCDAFLPPKDRTS